MHVRVARPSDYDEIVSVVDGWWGRPIAGSLPRLFLDHFCDTSLVVHSEDGKLAAFLVGIHSPSSAEDAYIHFVGVAPERRGAGLARMLYERFFARARADGRRRVSAITAMTNTGSIGFHRGLGFTVSEPIEAYNGPGTAMVRFDREL